MNTYHHLSSPGERLISIVYEFAEKELKNEDDSIYNLKIFCLDQQIKELKRVSTRLTPGDHRLLALAMSVIMKTMDWKDTSPLIEAISGKMDPEESWLQQTMAVSNNENTTDHALMQDIAYGLYGKKSFFRYENLLRNYIQKVKNEKYDDEQWLNYLGDLLRNHQYQSAYGDEYYTAGLENNLMTLGKMKKKLEKRKDTWLERALKVDESGLKEIKKKYAKIMDRPERGIETLFRLTSKNHYTLNAMVDRKSNILISINAIILSIVLGTLLGRINDDPHLILPVAMILITNLTSIVLAILATRPDKTHGNNAQAGFHHLLFYGNFKDMEEKSYVDGLNELMNNGEKLYESISRDIYYLGLHLDRKFDFVRKSFNTFMYGIILSVITFVICHLFFGDLAM
ncbi:DUF5706 domain-containing protein [Fulvivirgaceae bacterium BMA12]|uniref:DUF5706 domain-containing protein n=1 Tax=Agaribacillus aureus TaxID=3051825 RepID=A0ABT8LAT2_9BACT|nr:DUF5706 domain-containing protein [Fulvivirgaceae bacterium BMA12]